MRNKIMDEMLETIQDLVKTVVDCIYKLTQPKPEMTMIEKLLDYWTNWFNFFFHIEVKKERLFSDLVKNITRCKLD